MWNCRSLLLQHTKDAADQCDPTMKLTVEEIPNGLHVQLGYTQQKVSTDIPKVGEKSPSNQHKIIEAMKKNKNITYEELASIVGITATSI